MFFIKLILPDERKLWVSAVGTYNENYQEVGPMSISLVATEVPKIIEQFGKNTEIRIIPAEIVLATE